MIAALFAGNIYVLGITGFRDGLWCYISLIQTYFIGDFCSYLCIKMGLVVQLYLFALGCSKSMRSHHLLIACSLFLLKGRVNI
jgi:uncharacterized membrane protein